MNVATVLQPVVEAALGSHLPVRVDCWDGSSLGPPEAVVVVRFASRRALRDLLWAPNELGLADQVDIRVQDYRDVADGPYDAIASIGMAEHVGLSQLGGYAAALNALLAPGGRLLNHAISRRPGPPSDPKADKTSFIDRYVFPDGELLPLSVMVDVLESAGFEVRDVQSLREHYADTLRAWVANLERNWDQAMQLSSAGRARVWRLYMAGSAFGFASNRLGVNQVLAVKPGPTGASGSIALMGGSRP